MELTNAVQQLNNKLTAIADAVREKTGSTGAMSLDDIPVAVSSLGAGGGDTSAEDAVISGTVVEYTNNRVESIGRYIFQNNTALKKVTFNNVKTVKQSAFSGCTYMESVSMPKLETVDYEGFRSCQYLNWTELPSGLKSVGQGGFYFCNKLAVKNFPSTLTSIGSQGFQQCTKMTEANFYSDVTIGAQAFYQCNGLTKLYFKGKPTLDSGTHFRGCTQLKTVEFDDPRAVTIPTNCFYECSRIEVFILRSTTLSTLASTSAFTNSSIASGAGYIYVDDNLVDSYKTATNWSTYATKIKGISELGVSSIEIHVDDINKAFVTQTTANLTYNGGMAEVYLKEQMGVNWSITGNATIDENGVITLSNNAQAGDVITVTATSKYNSNITATATINVTEEAQFYSINTNGSQWVDSGTTVDGHTVYKSDAGSFNINNGTSTAIITVAGYTTFKVYIRSYAEGGFDYTEAFAVDTTASRSKGLYTTKSKQSATVYTECTYNLDGGIHTIQIMYSKDSSGNSNDDRGYFYVAGGE